MRKSSQTFSLKNSNATILAVDDDQRMLDSLLMCLKPYGLQVDLAVGGFEACEKLESNRYDMVLVDLNMPGISGHDVLTFAAEKNIHCPFVVVSGESSFNAVKKALKLGVSDYIKKPYSIDELIATISNTLQKRFLEKEYAAMQARVQQSESLHRYIVNSSPDIIFMLDQNGRFTFLNEKVEVLLGYKKEELLGSACLKLIDKDFRSKAIYHFQQGNSYNKNVSGFEVCLTKKSRSNLPRYFDISLFPIESQHLNEGYFGNVNANAIYGVARDITEQKEAEEFINFQAYHDTLTRLPNRTLFKDRLSLAINQAKRTDQMLAVMFLDLDRFKNVNDTLGHSVGDLLLEKVARRLELVLRSGDTLSRFGGDEFTLLLPALTSDIDAKLIAEKIITTLNEPFLIDGVELFIGVSIGVALYPESGTTIDKLIKNADQAMYHVKDRGKDGFCFHTRSMADNISRQLRLESDLRKAIEEDHFAVHYQPQIDTISGAILGVEALVRWVHPDRGIVCPAEFIAFAEETRLINEIGYKVLNTACREVKSWIDVTGKPIRLAVNFSPIQLESSNFVGIINDVLRETGFPVEYFELEMTENALMNNLGLIASKIEKLVSQGVTIAIDDFGTGYSSLNYINKLHIHTLKIDRSFIQQIPSIENGSSCVVNAITSMAQGLNLNIVAEGVETLEQLNYVRELGCHQAQGFYCGRPAPGDAILELLMDNSRNVVQLVRTT